MQQATMIVAKGEVKMKFIYAVLSCTCIDAIGFSSVFSPWNYVAGFMDMTRPAAQRPDPPGIVPVHPSETFPTGQSDPPASVAQDHSDHVTDYKIADGVKSEDKTDSIVAEAHFIPNYHYYRQIISLLRFEDAYSFSYKYLSHAAPQLNMTALKDQVLNDAVLFHNANLDDQYALQMWIMMVTSEEKTAVLRKLLKNPTVYFNRLNYGGLRMVFEEIIQLGDLNIFQNLYKKLEIDIDYRLVRHLTDFAADRGRVDIFKYILNQLKLNDEGMLSLQQSVAKSGNIELMKYLFEEYNLSDGRQLLIHPKIQNYAVKSGNMDIVKYVFDKYKKTHGEDLQVDTFNQLQAAEMGNLDILKYIFDKQKAVHGKKQKLQIRPFIQEHAAKSGNLDILRYLIDEKRMHINYGQIMTNARRVRAYYPKYMNNLLKYLHEEKRILIPRDLSHYSRDDIEYLKALKAKKWKFLF